MIDKNGYYHSPAFIFKHLARNNFTMLARRKGFSDDYADTFLENPSVLNEYKKIIRSRRCENFYDFVIGSQFRLRDNSKDNFRNAEDGFVDAISDEVGDTNTLLCYYHYYRFMSLGEHIYKIRRYKAEYLRGINLDIPANLLVLPHDEFLMSIPMGAIQTSQGSLLNIYVSQEKFDPKVYDDPRYEVQKNVVEVIKNNPISRIIRCYGISKKNEGDSGQSIYYQMPIIEGQSIKGQFMHLIDTSVFEHKEAIITMFGLMLNFCAYLSTKDPDVESVLGIRHKSTSNNPKKIRNCMKMDDMYGYKYNDVGRIYDTRYNSDSISHSDLGYIVRLHSVRRHIRAQWYGPRIDGKPGTHQQLIIIEEHVRGGEIGDVFQPRPVIVG